MTEIDRSAGGPEMSEVPAPVVKGTFGPEPYVIDPYLAARLFWTGVVAGERGLTGDLLLGAFTGAITETYPSVERHADIQRLGTVFNKVKDERRKPPSNDS